MELCLTRSDAMCFSHASQGSSCFSVSYQLLPAETFSVVLRRHVIEPAAEIRGCDFASGNGVFAAVANRCRTLSAKCAATFLVDESVVPTFRALNIRFFTSLRH